jgi:hypothetical protein
LEPTEVGSKPSRAGEKLACCKAWGKTGSNAAGRTPAFLALAAALLETFVAVARKIQNAAIAGPRGSGDTGGARPRLKIVDYQAAKAL